MRCVHLMLVSHCHVPDGLPESEYEKAYTEKLSPFLSALYRYPGIPAVLHYSGPLLYWIERRKPEFFDLIRNMLKRKQLELLGGGFYEPAFPIISPQDKTWQIEMLSTYLRKHFGQHCSGAYLPPCCWEHNVISALKNCSLYFTYLPESYFLQAGLTEAELSFPVFTENQGQIFLVFPVLPLNITKGMTEKDAANLVFKMVRERGDEGIYTVFCDKFSGEDVQSTASVSAFLESYLSYAELFDVNLTIPSRIKENADYIEKKQSLKRLYFYNKDMRDFLSKNPAANLIYAKMLDVRHIVQHIRGDKERRKSALHEIFRAQCFNIYSESEKYDTKNNSITNAALRRSAYTALISAEKIAREAARFRKSLSSFDYEFDGNSEDIFRGDKLNCFVHKRGGALFGFEYIPKCLNYIDNFKRNSFIETLFADNGIENITLEQLLSADVNARRLYENFWEEKEIDRTKLKLVLQSESLEKKRAGGRQTEPLFAENTAELSKENENALSPALPPLQTVNIEKAFQLKNDTLIVHYTLLNAGPKEESFMFCAEIHFAFCGSGEPYTRSFSISGENKTPVFFDGSLNSKIDALLFQDLSNETALQLSSEKQFSALLGETNEHGSYQSSDAYILFPVTLKSGQKISREFRLSVTH